MKQLKIAISGLFLVGGMLLNLTPGYAKPDYTKKEKKGCVTCHVSMKSKELNETGKCYAQKKKLEGCETAKPAS
jgi:hypothetical protein